MTSKACENKCFSGYLARLGGQRLAGTVVVEMASGKAASKRNCNRWIITYKAIAVIMAPMIMQIARHGNAQAY